MDTTSVLKQTVFSFGKAIGLETGIQISELLWDSFTGKSFNPEATELNSVLTNIDTLQANVDTLANQILYISAYQTAKNNCSNLLLPLKVEALEGITDTQYKLFDQFLSGKNSFYYQASAFMNTAYGVTFRDFGNTPPGEFFAANKIGGYAAEIKAELLNSPCSIYTFINTFSMLTISVTAVTSVLCHTAALAYGKLKELCDSDYGEKHFPEMLENYRQTLRSVENYFEVDPHDKKVVRATALTEKLADYITETVRALCGPAYTVYSQIPDTGVNCEIASYKLGDDHKVGLGDPMYDTATSTGADRFALKYTDSCHWWVSFSDRKKGQVAFAGPEQGYLCYINVWDQPATVSQVVTNAPGNSGHWNLLVYKEEKKGDMVFMLTSAADPKVAFANNHLWSINHHPGCWAFNKENYDQYWNLKIV